MRKKTKILDAEGRLEVLRLNKEGHSLREIAAILDVSGTQVHRIVRQAADNVARFRQYERRQERARDADGPPDHEEVRRWKDRYHAAELHIGQLKAEVEQAQRDLQCERKRASTAWLEAERYLRPNRLATVCATRDEIDGEVRLIVHMHYQQPPGQRRSYENQDRKRSVPLSDGTYVGEMIRTWLFPEKELPDPAPPKIAPDPLDFDEDDDE